MPSKMQNETSLLEINGATLVKNGTRILDNLCLTIPQGQHTAILGPNGSGKSSLIKLLTRQHYPLARRGDGPPILSIFGRERWHVSELRSLLGIVSADLHRDFTADEALTGRETVLSGFFAAQGLAAHHDVTRTMHAHAQEALNAVDAANLADKPLARMSTGEARRILSARALAPRPRALLLDEPTAGLDLIARRRFLESLRPLARSGVTLILVTHHAEEVIPEIERVILMREGAIFADGPKADVLTSAMLSALFDAPLVVQESGGYLSAEYE